MGVQLSGGNFGGEFIDWATEGILPDGRDYMTIDGFVYAKVSSDQAVFYGLAS